VHLEARKHLSFNVFDVGEQAATSDIAAFAGALNLHNEFLHQLQRGTVFFPEMMFANVRRLFLPVLGFLIPYCAQDRTWNASRRRIQELRREEKGNS
jgi:hypothetical protein